MHYFKQPVILKAYMVQKIVYLWSCDLLTYSYSRLRIFVGQFWISLGILESISLLVCCCWEEEERAPHARWEERGPQRHALWSVP